MKKQNIGTINALIRITMGFTGLAVGTVRLVQHPWRLRDLILVKLSAMKVAEGVTRYCPTTGLVKQQLVQQGIIQPNNGQSTNQPVNQTQPVNNESTGQPNPMNPKMNS